MPGSVRQPDLAIAHLHQLQVLTSGAIAQFYRESRQHYPKVQADLQRLDYLRRVLGFLRQPNLQYRRSHYGKIDCTMRLDCIRLKQFLHC
ncbi:MAG: hypothetical protein VKL59_16215 [Nostocaceae cyanobacterium]|nr:hypothetical protein [Nostocaceae cyanobacterium]